MAQPQGDGNTHVSLGAVGGTSGFIDPILVDTQRATQQSDGYAAGAQDSIVLQLVCVAWHTALALHLLPPLTTAPPGVTLLMVLVGLPVAMIRRHCRALLQSPSDPEAWQAPGLPDVHAEWPTFVALVLAGVVIGLAPGDAYADRLPCADARRELQLAYEAAGGASFVRGSSMPAPAHYSFSSSTAATVAAAAAAAATAGEAGSTEGRECVICMAAPRQVRSAPCDPYYTPLQYYTTPLTTPTSP